MLKIAGVVVLYNPQKDFVENILGYLNQLELLYIVENSERSNSIVISELKLNKNVQEIESRGNIGLAAALNIAANRALTDGFDLLLTMDQDSRISDKYILTMLKEFERDDKIGILSPFVVHNKNPKKSINTGIENVMTAMTSGSIIKLSAHQKIGGYLEKLFIDYVDNEYCLRMKNFGFKIQKLNSVYVYHELGNVKTRKFLYKKVFPTNHSPLRLYYRTRNRFYMYKIYKNKFPEYIKFDKWVFLKEVFKVFLYEERKIEKIKMIILGYLDFKRNKFGKYVVDK